MRPSMSREMTCRIGSDSGFQFILLMGFVSFFMAGVVVDDRVIYEFSYMFTFMSALLKLSFVQGLLFLAKLYLIEYFKVFLLGVIVVVAFFISFIYIYIYMLRYMYVNKLINSVGHYDCWAIGELLRRE